MTSDLLTQWNHLQHAIQRVSTASATNLSARIQTLECERSVFDDLMRSYVMESLGEFPAKEVDEAARWRKLLSDTNAVPCNYPCLRDNLADWLADNGEM